MSEIKDLEPKQMQPKPDVLVVSSDEEEVDGGDVMYLGTREKRVREGGMKMAMTVGEVYFRRGTLSHIPGSATLASLTPGASQRR